MTTLVIGCVALAALAMAMLALWNAVRCNRAMDTAIERAERLLRDMDKLK